MTRGSFLASLSNRIFLASALLAVISIAMAVFVVNRVVTQKAEEELGRSLEEAGALVEQFQALLFDHLVREARLIADLPKLKAAVSVNHAPTVQPLAEDYQKQIGADLFLVTNAFGEPLGSIGDAGRPAQELLTDPTIQRAIGGQETVTFWSSRTTLFQVVSVPIFIVKTGQAEILGTLTAGVSLDRRLANRIKEMTRSEVVFAAGDEVLASTLSDSSSPLLAHALTARGMVTVDLNGEQYFAVKRNLGLGSRAGQAAETPASGLVAAVENPQDLSRTSPPSVVTLRSRTQELRFLRTIHSALAVTAILAVLSATLLSYAVARTVTRPLGALTTMMREMAATGDLSRVNQPVHQTHWEDEDARVLTSAFRALTESLGRFQHEAALRERLSSLGRLSTVLAHEIRNPLMIIKASLRTLRREYQQPGASAATAIADIEGEAVRLNRLVDAVLDYARPIRFELSATDVSALCTDAASAAMAGQSTMSVSLSLSPAVGQITTDAERLRLVLVNILTNARDAVLASPEAADRGRDAPPWDAIDLRTSMPDATHVRITVQDSGVGMDRDQRTRIFEPFFTTKRTGSGLGLAIAKNIIDGLGGTIVVMSEPGHGTAVQVTLPRTPPGSAASGPSGALSAGSTTSGSERTGSVQADGVQPRPSPAGAVHSSHSS